MKNTPVQNLIDYMEANFHLTDEARQEFDKAIQAEQARATEIKAFIEWLHIRDEWRYDGVDDVWRLDGYRSRTTYELFDYYQLANQNTPPPQPFSVSPDRAEPDQKL
jgi:hypothetical protein